MKVSGAQQLSVVRGRATDQGKHTGAAHQGAHEEADEVGIQSFHDHLL